MSNLTPRLTFGALDLTDYPYGLGFDEDLGSPEVVYEIISSQLADGEIVSSDRVSNRSLAFTVLVEGGDLQELSDAEAALIAECDKAANTLSFDPGDGIGRTTVFETFRAQPRKVPSSAGEMSLVRRYEVTFPALPYPRSVDKVTDAAVAPPAGGGTVIAALDTAAGWSSASPAAAPVADTALFHQGTASVRTEAYTYNLTAFDAYGNPIAFGANFDEVTGLALSTSTGGYLSIWVQQDFTSTIVDNYGQQVPSQLMTWQLDYGTGYVQATFFAAEAAADGFVRYVTQVAASKTISKMKFYVQGYKWGHAGTIPKVRYDSVQLSTTATTDNQITKTFTVKGSVRAPGSLHVAAPSDSVALGSVLVATVHESDIRPGFTPDLRRWLTAGATTADTSAMHGSSLSSASYSSATQFEAPLSQYVPGNHHVVALAKVATGNATTIGVETQLTVSGVASGSSSTAEATHTPGVTGWVLVPVGTVRIPEVTNPDTTAKIRGRFKSPVPVDDIFLIPEAAAFSIAECGTAAVSASGSASHLWIDSPDAAQPSGGWWRGSSVAGINRRKINRVSELTKPGLHVFKPGVNVCWCVSTNADGPAVDLSHFPRWHTHAAL